MELTRRNLVKGAAAIGAVSAIPVSAAVASEAPAEPVEVVEADIVVVGSGLSGMCAAIQGAQLGAKVIVIEKAEVLGGSSNSAEVILGVGGRMQRELGLEYTPLEVLQREMAFHNYRVDWNLWKRIIEFSGDTIDWFLDIVEPRGGGFMAIVSDYGSPQITHMYAMTEIGEKGYAELIFMTEEARELGVEFRMGCAGKSLIQGEDGVVRGIMAETPDGLVEFDAKAVVLATGGFAGNTEMVAAENRNTAITALRGWPFSVGDGFRMAKEAGADENGAKCIQLMGPSLPLPVSLGDHINLASTMEGYACWVNQKAERFITEAGLIMTQAANAVDEQRYGFSIMDEALVDFLCEHETEVGQGSFILKGTKLEKVRENIEWLLEDEPEIAYKADTIAELAEQIGLDPAALEATISHYNEMCEAGEDTDYGKDAAHLKPISTPPFYALRLATNFLCTMGNIRIDGDARVLTPEYEPIVGLYAVGCDAGGFAGETYCVELPGGTQCVCANTGRLAAIHAVENLL